MRLKLNKNKEISDLYNDNHLQMFEFQQFDLLKGRIRTIAFLLIFSYPLYFFADYYLLKTLDHFTFKLTLFFIHLTGFLNSLTYVFINSSKLKKGKVYVPYITISVYLILGAAASINSQLYTGNIDAYIIILIAVAVLFPVHPRKLLFLYIPIHVLFLFGMYQMQPDVVRNSIKLINSTATVVISFFISLTFYRLRKKDFLNQQSLKMNEENFRKLFYSSPIPLILWDNVSKKVNLINDQAIHLYQLKPLEKLSSLDFIFPSLEQKEFIFKQIEEEKQIRNLILEQSMPHKKTWVMISVDTIEYLNQSTMLISITDITHLKIAEEKLLKEASIDELTGVLGRRSGLDILKNNLNHATLHRDFILCYIDINNLKIVNDQLGHKKGDQLIQIICKKIQQKITPHDILFRLGGDEFIIVFYDKSVKEVNKILRNITTDFRKVNDSKVYPFTLSASYGLYEYTTNQHHSLEEILELADQAMYKNKVKMKKQAQIQSNKK